MKRSFIFSLIVGIGIRLVSAGDRPLDAMVGQGVEIPVNVEPVAGGVIDSLAEFHERGFVMSVTAGEPFSGSINSDGYNLDMGYGFMEFYCDRIPISQYSLTVNEGNPVTNIRQVHLGVNFTDDLSGLSFASITERYSGLTRQLDVKAENLFDWKLGGDAENIPDGDFLFEFQFHDRAGNETVVASTASVRLDTVPPTDGSVLINNGNIYTSTQMVTLELTSTDNTSDTPTGVSYVRLANNATDFGTVFPFIEPKMSLQWKLADAAPGEKTVYANFRDAAGNWSTTTVSDTITLGVFSPGGTLSFVDDGDNVLKVASNTYEAHVVNVTLLLNWNLSAKGNLRKIQISGGPDTVTLDIPTDKTPPTTQPYAIASTGAVDGVYTVSAVFFDAEGNASQPVSESIRLNRDPPPDPDVVVTMSSSTMIFDIHSSSAHVRDVLYYTVTPSPGLESFGASSGTIPILYSSQPVTYMDDHLIPNMRYAYTVQAFDRFSGSPGFLTGPVYTFAEDPIRTDAPQGKEVSVIRVSWGTGQNPVDTQYQVEWASDADFSSVLGHSDWSFRDPIDVEKLSVGTTYYFHVKARNNAEPPIENISWTYLGAAMTQSFINPSPPSSLDAVDVASTSVLWRWARQPSTEEGFAITNGFGVIVATIPLTSAATTYEYIETGLTPNTLYSRYIQSYNHFNDTMTFSTPSRTVNVITKSAAPLVDTITVQGSEIDASWKANGNPEGTEYKADVSLTPGCDSSADSSDWIKTLSYSFRGLRPQTTYYVYAKARTQPDEHGQSFESACTQLGVVQTRTFDHGNEVDLSNEVPNWRVVLPAHALEEDYAVSMFGDESKFITTTPDVIRRATEKSMKETQGFRFPLPGGLVEVRLMNVNGEPLTKPLKKPGEIQHLYEHLLVNAANAGARSDEGGVINSAPDLSDPSASKNILVKTLRLYVLDTRTQSWFRLPSNNIDQFGGQVDGGVSSFGVFAVMGSPSLEVDQTLAFPVPWRPNGPNAGSGPGQTGTESDGIQFTNLPQQGELKILDLQGVLVKEFILTGNITETWDVRNGNGDKVVSGTYYWIVKAGEQSKTGKLVVIR